MQHHIKPFILYGSVGFTCFIPLLFIPLPAATLPDITGYLAAVIGYAGIVFLLWELALGTKSITGLVTADYSPFTKIHKVLGRYGTVFIFFHPLLYVVSFGESIFYSVVPHISTPYEAGVPLGRLALYVLGTIWLTSYVVRGRIAYRPWRYIHYLAYLIIPFVLLHIPNTGTTFKSSAAAKLFFVTSLTAYLFIVLLRLRSWLNIDRTRYAVMTQQPITNNVLQITLQPSGSRRITPHQGQYVFIKTGLISEDHPFTVLAANPHNGQLTVAYKKYGLFTNVLAGLPAGAPVYVSKPYGVFTSQIGRSHRPSVFIAGGIGITPFIGYIQQSKQPEWLFYANLAPQHAAYTTWLHAALGSRLVNLYQTKGQHDPGEIGFVTADIFAKYLQHPKQYDYYICGSKRLLKTAAQALASLGVPQHQVYTEKFD